MQWLPDDIDLTEYMQAPRDAPEGAHCLRFPGRSSCKAEIRSGNDRGAYAVEETESWSASALAS